jgi:hypothetical protein
MSGSSPPESPTNAAEAGVELELDAFGREMLAQQCVELGVSERELIRFALLYYFADLDSGRIARRIPDTQATSRSKGLD